VGEVELATVYDQLYCSDAAAAADDDDDDGDDDGSRPFETADAVTTQCCDREMILSGERRVRLGACGGTMSWMWTMAVEERFRVPLLDSTVKLTPIAMPARTRLGGISALGPSDTPPYPPPNTKLLLPQPSTHHHTHLLTQDDGDDDGDDEEEEEEEDGRSRSIELFAFSFTAEPARTDRRNPPSTTAWTPATKVVAVYAAVYTVPLLLVLLLCVFGLLGRWASKVKVYLSPGSSVPPGTKRDVVLADTEVEEEVENEEEMSEI